MPHHVVDIWWSDLRVMDRGLLPLLDPVEAARAAGLEGAADLGRFVVGAVLLGMAAWLVWGFVVGNVVDQMLAAGDDSHRPRAVVSRAAGADRQGDDEADEPEDPAGDDTGGHERGALAQFDGAAGGGQGVAMVVQAC